MRQASRPSWAATTAVARGRLEEGRLDGVEDVFVADAWGTGNRHFGSRLVFDGDGYLYVTVGDRGEMERAQDLGDHAGTTLRLLDDGSAPADNPFVGQADARDEIFTYGNRNAQGMVVHPETGEIWQSEHGPRGGDELNRMVPGANYGWPDYNFGDHYDGESIPDPEPGTGTELPLVHWTPAIAPAGMTIYTGTAFPQWHGDVFVGALVGEHLRRIHFENATPVEEQALLEEMGERVRDVVTGPDGLIYLLIDAPSAPLLRLEPEEE
jgi:aldose sugar dehydrogenase